MIRLRSILYRWILRKGTLITYTIKTYQEILYTCGCVSELVFILLARIVLLITQRRAHLVTRKGDPC